MISGNRRIECDLLCVSGGFNPAVHLFSQAGGRLRYEDRLACFVPDERPWRHRGGSAGRQASSGFPIQPTWLIRGNDGDYSKHFVDLERDVTVADLRRALGTGHAGRWST